MRVAVDDVLFLTTKGTEITKFSDIFIFVPFVPSVVETLHSFASVRVIRGSISSLCRWKEMFNHNGSGG